MMQVLGDAMVPVARGLMRASWARQRWTTFRYEQIEDMALLLLLMMD
jgi:hypothetical protein